MTQGTPRQADPRRIQLEARAFRDRFQSLLLATCDPEGGPDLSYAPYLLDDDQAFCLFISELANHTRNLRRNPHASVMFIEPEEEARNPFARRRLTLRCLAEEVAPEERDGLLERMEARFGNTLQLLRRLPDFHLFRLQVERGSYVRGFGQAWALAGNGLEVLQLRQG